MKILVVCQYFWPENFRVNDMVLGLKSKGHEVTVLTGKPNYPSGKIINGYSFFGNSKEVWQGVNIYRSPLIPRGNGSGIKLAMNYLSFSFFASLKALSKRFDVDVIFIYQLSPITMALPAIILKKKLRVPLVLYIQDLWPQSVVAGGGIKNKLIIGFLNKFTNWVYDSSDKILIQSQAFREFLILQKVKENKIEYLPNSTEVLYTKVEKNTDLNKYFGNGINLVFAGNIGEAQSFTTLIEAAERVKKSDNSIRWVIIGQGRKKVEFEKMVQDKNLSDVFRFIGSFSTEMMPSFFAHADALILSLKKEFIFSLTIPSKLQSYMACGKPIIGSLDGEGARIIQMSNCGLIAPAEDPEKLAERILEFKSLSIDQKKLYGINAQNYFKLEFNRNVILNKLTSSLEQLINEYE